MASYHCYKSGTMHDELTASQITELVNLLTQQKHELTRLLQDTQKNSAPVTLDQQSVGRVSRIDAIQQQQMAVANRDQAGIILKKISASLVRVANDEYGFCLECGEFIAYARLQVQAYAENCVGCQAMIEGK